MAAWCRPFGPLWLLLAAVVLVLMWAPRCSSTNGPCYKPETYNATVEMMVTVQVNKTRYDWCLGGFMRCPVFKLENVDRLQNVTQVHTRNVETCCPGTVLVSGPPPHGSNSTINCVFIQPSTVRTTSTTARPVVTSTARPVVTSTARPVTNKTTEITYPTTLTQSTVSSSTISITTPITIKSSSTTPPSSTSITSPSTKPTEVCRTGWWGKGCPHECMCGPGVSCDQDSGQCPPGFSPRPVPHKVTPAPLPSTTITVDEPSTRQAVTFLGGIQSSKPDAPRGMRPEDDAPLDVALGVLCIIMLLLAIAAINRHRIIRFINSGDPEWNSGPVRCSATGEQARISNTQGVMWRSGVQQNGEYDHPVSLVPMEEIGGTGDPLAERLAGNPTEPVYQEIVPRGASTTSSMTANGGPRGLRANSDAFK